MLEGKGVDVKQCVSLAEKIMQEAKECRKREGEAKEKRKKAGFLHKGKYRLEEVRQSDSATKWVEWGLKCQGVAHWMRERQKEEPKTEPAIETASPSAPPPYPKQRSPSQLLGPHIQVCIQL